MYDDEHSAKTPRVVEMRFTRAPRDTCWDLRVGGPGAQVALLGWVVDRSSIDAGVPGQAVKVITRAACRSHLLTFLCPDNGLARNTSAWTKVRSGWACKFEPPLIKRIWRQRSFPLLATSDPVRAESFFHSEGFSWELRGQVVLLSPSNARPPSLSYLEMERLFDKVTINPHEHLLSSEIEGILLPGVDGDFAELIAFNEALWRDLPGELEKECNVAGIAWSCVSEEVFKSTAWVVDGREE